MLAWERDSGLRHADAAVFAASNAVAAVVGMADINNPVIVPTTSPNVSTSTIRLFLVIEGWLLVWLRQWDSWQLLFHLRSSIHGERYSHKNCSKIITRLNSRK